MTANYIDKDIENESCEEVMDGDAFINKINNILFTPINSIPFLRDFGSNLEYYLFRPLSYVNANSIAIEIENRIRRHYPTATVTTEVGELDYTNRVYPITINIYHPKLRKEFKLEKRYQSVA